MKLLPDLAISNVSEVPGFSQHFTSPLEHNSDNNSHTDFFLQSLGSLSLRYVLFNFTSPSYRVGLQLVALIMNKKAGNKRGETDDS